MTKMIGIFEAYKNCYYTNLLCLIGTVPQRVIFAEEHMLNLHMIVISQLPTDNIIRCMHLIFMLRQFVYFSTARLLLLLLNLCDKELAVRFLHCGRLSIRQGSQSTDLGVRAVAPRGTRLLVVR